MTRKADGIPPPLVQAQPPRLGGRSWVTSPRKEFYNMTEQEKMEIVVVDTSTCTLYDFTASSWRGPRTPEEVLKAAQNSAADDIRRYENILNSGRYDDRKEYWTECLEAAKARTFSTMTYGDFLNAQRERLLSDPMQEITEQQFDDALNVLPPLAWHTRHNVEEFCSREFETGSYTMQYAYSLVQNKHYAKLVDYSDPSTWISSILERQ